MIHRFTDQNGNTYGFDFDARTVAPSVSVTVYYRDVYSPDEGEAWNSISIIDGKIVWDEWCDMWISEEARQYCERLAKLKAFL